MGSVTADKHFNHQKRFAFYGQHFYIGHQTRCNAIGDQVAQPFFFVERVADADDLAVIGDADHQPAACGVGEGHQSF